jgi:hypothetical protein
MENKQPFVQWAQDRGHLYLTIETDSQYHLEIGSETINFTSNTTKRSLNRKWCDEIDDQKVKSRYLPQQLKLELTKKEPKWWNGPFSEKLPIDRITVKIDWSKWANESDSEPEEGMGQFGGFPGMEGFDPSQPSSMEHFGSDDGQEEEGAEGGGGGDVEVEGDEEVEGGEDEGEQQVVED